jgi:hypothetical protein
MSTSTIINFRKSEDCPSSAELLEYQVGESSASRSSEVRLHLGSCEFCSAELEFYCHYPQEENVFDYSEVIQIPGPLFELAEALLKNRSGDSASLNDLLREKDDLVLGQV